MLFKRIGAFSTLIWMAIGLVLLYNICYNHILACLVKPGGPKGLRKVENLRDIYKRRTNRKSVKAQLDDDTRFEGVSSEAKQLLKYRHKTSDDMFWCTKKCSKCDDWKPARAHHCSVCKQCQFAMDHHCPWVMNCVGLENRRYFLLFCFYLLLGSLYMLLTLGAVHKSHVVHTEKKELFSFVFFLDVFLFVAMIGFNAWNWKFALTGQTTIEYFTNQLRDDMSSRGKVYYDFSFKSASDNLWMIFGTNKLFRVLSPSMRNVPFTGIEWAFLMREAGYSQEGVKYLTDDEIAQIEMQEKLE